MKNTNNFLLLVFCLVFLLINTTSSVRADDRCLNASGSVYPDSASGSSVCYSCQDGVCTPNGKTLSQYRSSSTPGQAPAPIPQQPVPQQPVAQQPVTEQPVREQPVPQQPVTEQPAGQQPVPQQPVTEQPAGQQPVTEQPLYPEPVAEQPVGQQPGTEQPWYPEPAAEQPTGQQPGTEQPWYPEPVAEQPTGQQPVTEQPWYPEPAAEQPGYQQTDPGLYTESTGDPNYYTNPIYNVTGNGDRGGLYDEGPETITPVIGRSEQNTTQIQPVEQETLIIPVMVITTAEPEIPTDISADISAENDQEEETGSNIIPAFAVTETETIPAVKPEAGNPETGESGFDQETAFIETTPDSTETPVPEETDTGTDITAAVGKTKPNAVETNIPEETDPDTDITPAINKTAPGTDETPVSEGTDTDIIPGDGETDPNVNETSVPEDTGSETDTVPKSGVTGNPVLISEQALEELSAQLSEEELANLLGNISGETLAGLTGIVSEETLDELYTLIPAETTVPEAALTPEPVDIISLLSEEALAEFSQLYTKEEIIALLSNLSEETLDGLTGMVSEETLAELSALISAETTGPETILTPEPVDIVSLISEEALAELSQLYTEEEIIAMLSIMSEETLAELTDILSEETLAELLELLSRREADPVLKSIPIEGTLNEIKLSTPNGGTVETSAVNFTWVYDYTEGSASVNVYFTLSLGIDDLDHGTHTDMTTTVNSASCANYICSYTAGTELSAYKNALVTWTVSGKYGTTTVNAANGPLSFILKNKPTPPPQPKPEAPVLECPKGRYITRDLGFYWAPSKNAESYTVNWWDNKKHSGSMTLSNNDPTCQGGRCIVHATMPGEGKYTWSVTAKNESGSARSGEMHFEIASNITTPSTHSPSGSISNNKYIEFEWDDVQDGAVEYHIQVVGKYDNRFYLDRWFRVKDIYVGHGICYVQTDLFLPAGSYSWRVQARNDSFSSGWSGWRDFYVQSYYNPYTYTNTVPSVSYPVGTITILNPQFQWRTLTGAAYYMVKLTDPSGNILFDRQITSSGTCTTELCTWNPNYTLPGNGVYTWTVSGYGSNGSFWGTSSGSFTVQAAIQLKPMSFLSPVPNGYLNPESPLVIWTDPGEAAVMFTVEIYGPNKNLLLNASLNREQAWCDGISCTIQFQSIPDGENYRITVTPYSELNTKGQTIELVFNKGGQTVLLNSPKDGSIVSSRPMFRWSLDAGTDVRYELILTDAKNNVLTFSPLVCGAVGVNCEDGEAYFSPADPIPAGQYSGKIAISGVHSAGKEVHFTVK